MTLRWLYLLICFFFFFHSQFTLAILETAHFHVIHDNLIEELKQKSHHEVLLVLDIDNTLLEMNQNFGSDQWFEWQSYLLSNEPHHNMLVSSHFVALLRIQGILFYIGRMSPPEYNIPNLILDLQKRGVATIVLTSRGHEFRNATERELHRNQYDFLESSIGPRGGYPSRFSPYQADDLEYYGLTKEEAQNWNLPDVPSLVSYQDGIFMSAGQHKGAMIRTLLAKTKQQFSKIVFVDDHLKHCLRVEAAFLNSEVQVDTYYYTATAARVQNFNSSNKQKEHEQWLELKELLTDYNH